jgi:hypothetical protein
MLKIGILAGGPVSTFAGPNEQRHGPLVMVVVPNFAAKIRRTNYYLLFVQLHERWRTHTSITLFIDTKFKF